MRKNDRKPADGAASCCGAAAPLQEACPEDGNIYGKSAVTHIWQSVVLRYVLRGRKTKEKQKKG